MPPELKWTREGPSRTIEAIWGSGPQDIYAVGRTGALLHSTGDGTWRTLDAGTGANLTGVWGSGPNDVYVAVDANVILHFSGSTPWERQVLDSGWTFTGIWGSGPNDLYALGPGALHGSASGWERPPQSVASGGLLSAIWGSSPTDIYVTCSGACTRKIFHSTGNGTWTAQNSPPATETSDVWGADATHVYVGADNSVLFSSGDGTWTPQLTTPGTQQVYAGWAANKDAVYACTQGGYFYRSNGRGTWSEGQDIDPMSTGSCAAIWGTGPDNIYIGASGIYHGTPAP